MDSDHVKQSSLHTSLILFPKLVFSFLIYLITSLDIQDLSSASPASVPFNIKELDSS